MYTGIAVDIEAAHKLVVDAKIHILDLSEADAAHFPVALVG